MSRGALTGIVAGAFALASPAVAGHEATNSVPPLPEMQAQLVGELERLTEGLLLTSESDTPIQIVTWSRPGGPPTAARIATLTGEAHPDVVETMSLDRFFEAPTRSWQRHDAEEQAVIRKFQAVREFFKTHLHDVGVFRFGRTTIRSYVVGTTVRGDWLGLAAVQTET